MVRGVSSDLRRRDKILGFQNKRRPHSCTGHHNVEHPWWIMYYINIPLYSLFNANDRYGSHIFCVLYLRAPDIICTHHLLVWYRNRVIPFLNLKCAILFAHRVYLQHNVSMSDGLVILSVYFINLLWRYTTGQRHMALQLNPPTMVTHFVKLGKIQFPYTCQSFPSIHGLYRPVAIIPTRLKH